MEGLSPLTAEIGSAHHQYIDLEFGEQPVATVGGWIHHMSMIAFFLAGSLVATLAAAAVLIRVLLTL